MSKPLFDFFKGIILIFTKAYKNLASILTLVHIAHTLIFLMQFYHNFGQINI